MTEHDPGKTFADVLDTMLTNPKRAFAFLGLTAASLVLMTGLAFGAARALGIRPRELSIGSGTNSVLLEQRGGWFGQDSEYVAIVDPQGWQDSGIQVREGDHLTFTAGGRVNIDVAGIIHNSDLRNDIENKSGIVPDDKEVAPEDRYSDPQRKLLRLTRPWVDPAGFQNEPSVNLTWGVRTKRKAKPDAPVGALLAYIRGRNATDPRTRPPDANDMILIGTGTAKPLIPGKTGNLWFIVNDILYSKQDEDQANADLFYRDNIGFFWVRIRNE